jgi:hypothetical protein
MPAWTPSVLQALTISTHNDGSVCKLELSIAGAALPEALPCQCRNSPQDFV